MSQCGSIITSYNDELVCSVNSFEFLKERERMQLMLPHWLMELVRELTQRCSEESTHPNHHHPASPSLSGHSTRSRDKSEQREQQNQTNRAKYDGLVHLIKLIFI